MTGCEAPDPPTMFKDITRESGIGAFRHDNGARGDYWFPEIMGSGVAFTDFNGDGSPDIALVRGGALEMDSSPPTLTLYRNDGAGYFSDVTREWGLAELASYGMGIVAGDIDNDGDEDLYLTTTEKNILLVNEGGRFSDGTVKAGLDDSTGWDVAAVFLDADRDGWLDLFVGSYVDWTPSTDMFCSPDGTRKGYCTPHLYQAGTSRFYRNLGDGTFANRAREAGLDNTGKTLGATALDVNGDGWLDLAVANDTDPDRLYLNQGDGTYVDDGLFMGMALDARGRARAGMGIESGIVDSAGLPTLFVGNFSQEESSVFRYGSAGRFEERAAASGIGRVSIAALTFGLVLTDADLDGDLDLLAANGHVHPYVEERSDIETFRQYPQLFINDGTGYFSEQGRDRGFAQAIVGRGAAAADIDGDGDQDLLITENGGPAHLYGNEWIPRGSWLRVHLEGVVSNRSAIGAQIITSVGGHRQYRMVRAGGSYASQSELTASFGLGGSQLVDTLIVRWPSGQVQQWFDVASGQTLNIVEAIRE